MAERETVQYTASLPTVKPPRNEYRTRTQPVMLDRLRRWFRDEPRVRTIDLPADVTGPANDERVRTVPDEVATTLANAGWSVCDIEPTDPLLAASEEGMSEAYTVTIERHRTIADRDEEPVGPREERRDE